MNIEKNYDIGKNYYVIQTWCRDGDHEYSDIFLITNIPKDTDEDLIDKAILTWNYGDCECDNFENVYSDGGWRLLSIRQIDEISQTEHDALKARISTFPFSSILDGYNENQKFKSEIDKPITHLKEATNEQ